MKNTQNRFQKVMNTVTEAVGDTDRGVDGKPRFPVDASNEYITDSTVYAMDYEAKKDIMTSVYVTSEDIYRYVTLFSEGCYGTYRFSNDGQTVRSMECTGAICDIPVGILKDIYSMCRSAFSRSEMKAQNDSATSMVSNKFESETLKMPKLIKFGGVIYEASEANGNEIVDNMIDFDEGVSTDTVKIEEAAKTFFKDAIIEAVLYNKRLDETEGSYGRIEKIDFDDNTGIMDVHMSIEMPVVGDGEPKYVNMKVKIVDKHGDSNYLDNIFDFVFKDIKITNDAIGMELINESESNGKPNINKAVGEAVRTAVRDSTNYMSEIVKGLEDIGKSKSISRFLLLNKDIYGYKKFSKTNINFARVLEGTGKEVNVRYYEGGNGPGYISCDLSLSYGDKPVVVTLVQEFNTDGSDECFKVMDSSVNNRPAEYKCAKNDTIFDLQNNIKLAIKEYITGNSDTTVITESDSYTNRPLSSRNAITEGKFDDRQIRLESWLTSNGFYLGMSAASLIGGVFEEDEAETQNTDSWLLKAVKGETVIYIGFVNNVASVLYTVPPAEASDGDTLRVFNDSSLDEKKTIIDHVVTSDIDRVRSFLSKKNLI